MTCIATNHDTLELKCIKENLHKKIVLEDMGNVSDVTTTSERGRATAACSSVKVHVTSFFTRHWSEKLLVLFLNIHTFSVSLTVPS